MAIKRTLAEIAVQIKNVMEDYLREPSDRTLGYLQLLLNFYDSKQKPIDYFDKPINDLPITKTGQGRTDALKWLHGEGGLYTEPKQKTEGGA